MSNQIKDVFQDVHASEALKNKTKEYVFNHKRYPYQKKVWHWALGMACFLCVLCIGGFYHAYFTPVAAISVDVNPSIELEINCFDRVVKMRGYNDEGNALLEDVDAMHMDYMDALLAIMDDEKMASYLNRDEMLSIVIVDENQKRSERMVSNVKKCVKNKSNVHCRAIDTESVDNAHESGVSYGKYHAYLLLHELDDTITIEDVQAMTMKEIQCRIDAYGKNASIKNGNGKHRRKQKRVHHDDK